MPKKTLKLVKEINNEAIIQVKGNQKMLLKSCKRTAQAAPPTERYTTRTKGRNRRERRTLWVYDTFEYFLKKAESWKTYIAVVIRMNRTKKEFNTKTKQWNETREESFYIATKRFTAKECHRAIRKHWWIENKNHYVRDVSMHEDQSRIRINPDRFVKMRSFALNILRVNGEKNIKQARFENALDLKKVLKYRYLL